MPVTITLQNHVLTLEIDRPERRNTLDAPMLEALREAFVRAREDEQVRVVFLHAQPGIFCAGGDLTEQLANPSADPDTPTGRMIDALSACTKPVVACVEGPAVGLAVTMLYYCDLVYAGKRALFSLPFTALGLTPRYGVSILALLNGGYHKAAEKILLSEPIRAIEAPDMRIVSGVFEDDIVRAQCRARVERLAKMSPEAVQSAKRLLREAWSRRLADLRASETAAFAEVSTTEHSRQAVAAFLEGRQPSC